MASVLDLFAKLSLDSTEYERGLDEAKGKASGAGSKIGAALGTGIKVAGAAVTAASAAVTAFAKTSVDAGMSFDSAMSQVQAISGANAGQFQQLRDKAQEMGATTKFSATEAAEAMNYMAMAGWKTEDMLNGISGIMNLAAASGEDLATTSDIVTDALTAFGLTAADSGRFADILAAAATNSNTNVGMMGDTFKYVAPLAGRMGYSAEDTAVAIGLMANSGIKASQAGTALRSILTRLAKPTKDSQTAMNALGISLEDGNGHMYSFMEVMEQMRDGFSNKLVIPASEVETALADLNSQLEAGTLTQKQYDKEVETLMERAYGAEGALMAQYAAMLGGQEAMSGLLAIVGASDEDFAKLTASIQNSSDVMVKTADGSIMSLNEAIASGAEVIAEYNGAAEAMSAVMEDNLQGDITSLNSALEGLRIAISDRLTPSLRDFVQFGRDGVRQLTVAFKQDGLQGALEALGPVIDQGIQLLFNALPNILTAAVALLDALVTAIITNLPKLVPAVVQLIQTFTQNIVQNLPMLLDAAIEIIGALTDGLIQMLPQLIPAIVQIITTIVAKLTEPETFALLVSAAAQIIHALAEGLVNAFPALQAIGTSGVEAIIAGIAGALTAAKVISTIGNFIAMFKGIATAITAAGGLIPALTALISPIGLVVAAIGAAIAIGVLLYKNWDTIKETCERVWDAVKEKISNVIDRINFDFEILKLAFGLVRDWFNEKIDDIKEKWQELKDDLSEKGERIKEIWADIKDSFAQAWEGIQRFLDETIPNAFNSVITFLSELPQRALEWGQDLLDNFLQGIRNKWKELKSVLGRLADFIVDYIGFSEPKKGPLSNFHTFAPDMMELFAKGIRDNENLVTAQINKSLDFEDFSGTGTFSGNRTQYTTPSVDTGRMEALLERNVTLLERISGEFSGLRVKGRMAM